MIEKLSFRQVLQQALLNEVAHNNNKKNTTQAKDETTTTTTTATTDKITNNKNSPSPSSPPTTDEEDYHLTESISSYSLAQHDEDDEGDEKSHEEEEEGTDTQTNGHNNHDNNNSNSNNNNTDTSSSRSCSNRYSYSSFENLDFPSNLEELGRMLNQPITTENLFSAPSANTASTPSTTTTTTKGRLSSSLSSHLIALSSPGSFSSASPCPNTCSSTSTSTSSSSSPPSSSASTLSVSTASYSATSTSPSPNTSSTLVSQLTAILHEGTCEELQRFLQDNPTFDVRKLEQLTNNRRSALHLVCRRPTVRATTTTTTTTNTTNTTNTTTSVENGSNSSQVEELITYLVQTLNIPVDVTDQMKGTPLFYACSSGNTQACLTLIHYGANVNLKDTNENFPLLLAARKNYMDIVSLLILSGADVNMAGRKGNTVLHQLLSSPSDLVSTQTVIRFIEQCGDKLILSAKNRHDEPPIFHSVNQPDKLNVMLSVMAKRREQQQQQKSSSMGEHSLTSCLSSSPPTSSSSSTSSTSYNQSGSNSMRKWVMTCDERGQNLIHKIAENGSLKSLVIVASHISSDALLNQMLNEHDTIHGNTPLHLAIMSGRGNMAQLFAKCSDVNVNAQNKQGDTPLHLAISTRLQEVALSLFSDHQVKLDVPNSLNHTALDLWNASEFSLHDGSETPGLPLHFQGDDTTIIHCSPKSACINTCDIKFVNSIFNYTNWKVVHRERDNRTVASGNTFRFSDGNSLGSLKKMYRTEGTIPLPSDQFVNLLIEHLRTHCAWMQHLNGEESPRNVIVEMTTKEIMSKSTSIPTSVWAYHQVFPWPLVSRTFMILTTFIYDTERDEYIFISKPCQSSKSDAEQTPRKKKDVHPNKLFSAWIIKKGSEPNTCTYSYIDCRDIGSTEVKGLQNKVDKMRHSSFTHTLRTEAMKRKSEMNKHK